MSGKDRVDSSHFACPVCLDVPREHIFMCTKSHNVCSECHGSLPVPKNCPTCRQSYDAPVRRNFTLEQVVASLTDIDFKCKHSKWGCKVAEKRSEIVEHEKQCHFQPFPCPECEELLSVNSFTDHCTKDAHKIHTTGKMANNQLVTTYPATGSETDYGPSVFTWKETHFMFFWKFVEEQSMSFFWVAVAGSASVEERYTCEIALVNDRIEPTYKYKGPVLSMDKKLEDDSGNATD